jgi:hypothetical protein
MKHAVLQPLRPDGGVSVSAGPRRARCRTLIERTQRGPGSGAEYQNLARRADSVRDVRAPFEHHGDQLHHLARAVDDRLRSADLGHGRSGVCLHSEASGGAGSNCAVAVGAAGYVVVPFSAYSQNDLLLSMMRTLVRDDVDWEQVRQAFESTRGDFTAKFTAAVQARLAQLVVPEVFIDLPEHPEELRNSGLEALVRPAADGFLRSYPNKDELLDQAERIRRRQERRPAWIPRLDRDGRPIPGPEANSADVEVHPRTPAGGHRPRRTRRRDRPAACPAEERAELAMAPAGLVNGKRPCTRCWL